MLALKERNLLSSSKPICFNFDFSILAIEEKQAVQGPKEIEENFSVSQKPSLIGVQFVGTKMGSANLIADDKILCIL